ncbi:MAG TPA: 30S ribosomal protein S7 [Candidatus Nanoarchaeia archaeon]|nr:30S ribosomal protein S7 [Candidatus Nanoarchaeia archaeon]
MVEQTPLAFKAFDLYDVTGVVVKDPSLKPYLYFVPKLLLKSHGRMRERFAKTKMTVIERLAGRVSVPGHVGKKHKIITNWGSGQYNKNMATVLKAFAIVAEKTKQNPVQVLVDAIENGSPRDEITVIEHGGARYPQAVDCSPVRRIDLALRWMIVGAYGKAFGKKKKIAETLAAEIIAASQASQDSYAFSKKNEAEKQADSAR